MTDLNVASQINSYRTLTNELIQRDYLGMIENEVKEDNMKRITNIGILSYLGLLLVATPSGATAATTQKKVQKQTLSSLENALQLSQSQKKPLLLYFHADWCSPCKAFDKVIASEEVTKLLTNDFVFMSIDGDTDIGKTLSDKFKVPGYPMVLLIDDAGNLQEKIVSQYTGSLETSFRFSQKLKKIKNGTYNRLTESIEEWSTIQNKKEKAEITFTIITEYIAQENEAKALEWLGNIIKFDPNDTYGFTSASYFIIATDLYESTLKNPAKAFEYFGIIVEKYPQSAWAAVVVGNRARLLIRDGKLEEALEMYRQLIARGPQNISALNHFIRICLENKVHYEEALEFAERGTQIDPKFDQIWIQKAHLYRRLMKCDLAYQAAQQAVKLNQKNEAANKALSESKICLSKKL